MKKKEIVNLKAQIEEEKIIQETLTYEKKEKEVAC